MFRGAAEIGEQRRAQQRPPEAVDSYPIAVQRKLQPPVGTKIGVRPPCDIGKQTGGVAKAGQLRRLVGEQRRDPLVQFLALSLEPPFPVAFGARRLDQRVADRKSVVSGTSASVRFDLGGRRLIKKKNNN